MKFLCIGLILAAINLPLYATEYFVGINGNDKHTGINKDEPLASLQRAANKLCPGDILTILPGVYRQSIKLEYAGGAKMTLIRAAIPGTVLLRGDVEAPKFERFQKSNFIWKCRIAKKPQAVNERDTLLIYQEAPSLKELEYTQGGWYYQENEKNLYIHTGDSASPSKHFLTISNKHKHGIYIVPPKGKKLRNLIIEGINICGFNNNSRCWPRGAKWGVYLNLPENCVIRNMKVFLNGNGIGMTGAEKCVIENCRSYANGSKFAGSGGNIVCFGLDSAPNNQSVIRNCISFDSLRAGIRFYGHTIASIMERCVAIDNRFGNLWAKFRQKGMVPIRRCISNDYIYGPWIERCLANRQTFNNPKITASILRNNEKDFSDNKEFADPEKFDYRPQSDSQYIKRAPEDFNSQVFFVKNNGNDSADGNSVKTALRSLHQGVSRLRDNSTLYLLPGKWKNQKLVIKDLKNIKLCGRGDIPVAIEGKVVIENCENISLERLTFETLILRNSQQITVKQCGFKGKFCVNQVAELIIEHNAFNNCILEVNNSSSLIIMSNIFGNKSGWKSDKAPAFSDGNSYVDKIPLLEVNSIKCKPAFVANFQVKNPVEFDGRALDGMPIGPYRRQGLPAPLKFYAPTVLSSTATTANIEFFSNYPVNAELYYGKTNACKNKLLLKNFSSFNNVGLTGLTPGNTYFFRINAKAWVRHHWSNGASGKYAKRRYAKTEIKKFTLKLKELPQKIIHVSPTGDDENSGAKTHPLKTISRAAELAVAGDIVEIHGGTYMETIRVRSTGDKSRPITFRSAKNEKVLIDGQGLLTRGISANSKKHLIFDGLYLRQFRKMREFYDGAFFLSDTESVSISRCLYDGRKQGTPAMFSAINSKNLKIDNCVSISGWFGGTFNHCPNLQIRNSVFYLNRQNCINVENAPNEKFSLKNNIFTDLIVMKISNPIIWSDQRESLIEQNNCFYMRVTPAQRIMFWFGGPGCFRYKEKHNYLSYIKAINKKNDALFVNPEMPVLNKLIHYPSVEYGKKHFFEYNSEHEKNEYHHIKFGKYRELDFSEFFSKNPELIKHNIGLEPKQFTTLKRN